MFVDVEKMLPDKLLKMISLLTEEKKKKEKWKNILKRLIKEMAHMNLLNFKNKF